MKSIIKQTFGAVGFEINRKRRIDVTPPAKFSHLDEETVIARYLSELQIKSGFCVDVAASDGRTMSNTYALYRQGWSGLAVECDAKKFALLAQAYADFPSVVLTRCMANPLNIASILLAGSTPEKFEFLNLDIDGYDYHVLREILKHFRPMLICTEINEKIPPPIRFSVNWNPNYVWNMDHFYGQSISMLEKACTDFSYSLVELHYNNVFLIPTELVKRPIPPIDALYREGYVNKADRRERFPWNSDVEEALHLPPEKALEYFSAYFKKYDGQFSLSL